MFFRRITQTITYALQRAFNGRNGFDQLSWLLFGISMLAAVLVRAANTKWAIVIYFAGFLACVFRALSRDISKRRRENQWLLSKTRRATAWFRLRQKMLRERHTHRYVRCPECGQWLRLPRGKGKISVSCSMCRKEFIKKV